MSWDDFSACAGREADALADVGEDAIKEIAKLWRSLPPDIKAALGVAARFGARYLAAALAAVGIAASEAIAAVAAGVGLGVLMDLIISCYDKL